MTEHGARLVDVGVALVAVGFFVARQLVDVGPAARWAVLIAMAGYTIWRVRRRAPYRAKHR